MLFLQLFERRAHLVGEQSSELVQGTLDMLILKTLELEPMHGWGIAQRIRQMSGGVFEINPGSLFPAFRRLERAGLLDCEWRTSENNRRAKYYSLTKMGRKKLTQETRDWARQVAAIGKILATAS
jgi:PadR family transcriptional regulator PadR